jgi:hypothetical protein
MGIIKVMRVRCFGHAERIGETRNIIWVVEYDGKRPLGTDFPTFFTYGTPNFNDSPYGKGVQNNKWPQKSESYM